MPWLVQKIVIWTFLCLAYIGAETDVCNLGDCRGREGRNIQQKKILRKLLRKNGAVLSSNVVLSSTEDRTRCLARTAIQPGELLFEIPLSISLWRGTVTLPNLPRNSRLSDIDKLVLYLALLMKDFLSEDSFKSTPLVAYAGQLLLEGSNATILWPQTALSWLVGTEAQEVTEHFLRRVSMIHAAAPLEVDYQDVKVAFAHFYARHLKLPGSQPEAILLPGIDWCRQREASATTLVLVPERQVVQLRASGIVQAGEEIFVETGVHDNTDLVLRGESTTPSAGEVLMVPFNGDETSAQKRLLFQQLNWPMEIRLTDDGVQDLKGLRLASMPKEEFTSWSVGALIAGAPLAVSRAFRTEVQATTYLLEECSKRGAATRSHPQAQQAELDLQAKIASRYRKTLTEIYEKCQLRSRQKLDKLLVWAMKQHGWIFNYVQEAILMAEKRILKSKAFKVKAVPTMVASDNPLKLPILEDSSSLRQMTDMIAAIVNTKVPDFVPYFQQLLQVTKLRHLKKVQRLALAMARLEGVTDLADFAWINHLQGGQDVFTSFKYLLPEMEKLAEEFNPTLATLAAFQVSRGQRWGRLRSLCSFGFAPLQPTDHLVKLLLLGDSAVGKSSLLMRFCESKFDANFVLTIGVDFKWKQVERNQRKLKIQVWDTAGQERFRTITPAYYRAAMGVVICYDITDKASFEHIDYWLQQLEQHGDEGVQRVLVGNKADLNENRKVTKEEGQKLATQYNMKFFETSAKTGQDVDEAFLSIADDVVKQRYSDVQPNAFQVKQTKPSKGGCKC